jgi:hypothetical protein
VNPPGELNKRHRRQVMSGKRQIATGIICLASLVLPACYFVQPDVCGQGYKHQPQEVLVEDKSRCFGATPESPEKLRAVNIGGRLIDDEGPFSIIKTRPLVLKGGKWGFIDDATNRVLIPPQFDAADFFSDGLAAVETDQQWGYIDNSGKVIVPFKFGSAGRFYGGLADVAINQQWGFIDKNGKVIVPLQFDEVRNYKDGVAVGVSIAGKWGFFDKNGKQLTLLEFDEIREFNEGFAPVGVNVNGSKKWGYIDKKGQEITPPKFDDARGFSEGLAAVSIAGKWGYIDSTGTMVIQPQFGFAYPFRQGVASVDSRDGKRFTINKPKP